MFYCAKNSDKSFSTLGIGITELICEINSKGIHKNNHMTKYTNQVVMSCKEGLEQSLFYLFTKWKILDMYKLKIFAGNKLRFD